MREPPRGGTTPSLMSRFAMAWSGSAFALRPQLPCAYPDRLRVDGTAAPLAWELPQRVPCALCDTARSHSATDAITFATRRPPGVLVSTPRVHRDEGRAPSFEAGEELGQVADTPSGPVESCNHERIDLPVVDHRESPLQGRPVERLPRRRVLQVGDERPAAKEDRREDGLPRGQTPTVS